MKSVRKLLADRGLEAAFLLSVVVLVLQLAWPTIDAWRNRPRAGRMGVHHIGKVDETFPGLAKRTLIYLPEQFNGPSQEWPLLLYLHGSGERAWDPAEVERFGLPARLGSDFHLPAIVVAPQCTPSQSWNTESLVELLDTVESQYPVDRRRVYVMGHSMGGFGAWELARRVPDRIAAVLLLCGGGEVRESDEVRDVAVWAIHGEGDAVVPPDRSLTLVSHLKAKGLRAKHTLLPGEGHAIQDYPFSHPEVFDWLFSQHKHKVRAA